MYSFHKNMNQDKNISLSYLDSYYKSYTVLKKVLCLELVAISIPFDWFLVNLHYLFCPSILFCFSWTTFIPLPRFSLLFHIRLKRFCLILIIRLRLDLYYKSRHKHTLYVTINYTQKRRFLMATNNYTKYDEDFKKSLVSLH